MKINYLLFVLLLVYLFNISNGCIYQNPNNLEQIYNFTSIVLPKDKFYSSYFPDAFLMKGLYFNVSFNLCNQPVPSSHCGSNNSSACQLGFRNEVGSIYIPEILSFGKNQLNITYTAKPKSDCTRRGLFVFTCNPLTDITIKSSSEVGLCLYQTNIESKFVCDQFSTPIPTNAPKKCPGVPEPCGGQSRGYCTSYGYCVCYDKFIGEDCSQSKNETDYSQSSSSRYESESEELTEAPIEASSELPTEAPIEASSEAPTEAPIPPKIICELSENGLFVNSSGNPIKCIGHGPTVCIFSNGDICKSNKGVIECYSKKSSILCKGTFIDCETSNVSCSFHSINTNRLFVNGIENTNKSKIYKN